MFQDLPKYPASILFAGIVLGLLARDELVRPEGAAVAALACTALSLVLRSSVRLLIALAFASFAGGVSAGLELDRSKTEHRELIRSLPEGRFVELTATVDQPWREGRDGVSTTVRSFVIHLPERTITVEEELSIYAPETVEPLGNRDFIRVEGFLRESTRGRLYASVESARLVELDSKRARWHPHAWNRAFRSLLERHASIFPEHERGVALIRAIVLGDGSALSSELRDSYRRGGTYHLLVFSGMQIALAAAVLTLLLRAIRLRAATDLALVLLALITPPFAGNAPSVSRAAMMIGLFGLSRLLRRPTPMPNLLFLSASIRLIMHPDELSSPGFLLTYAATFGLVVVGRSIAAVTADRAAPFAYGVGAELCTQPVTLLFFRQYVVGGFAVTIVLAPLLTAILVLSIPVAISLALDSDLAWILLELVARLDETAVTVNELSRALRLSGFAPAPPPLLVLFSFHSVWILFLSRAGPRMRAAGSTLLLLLVPLEILLGGAGKEAVRPVIEFLDVGQGDATLIRSEKTVLVDGGGSASDPDFGRRVLVPILADRGIDRLDVLAMSHPDIDHCGGLVSLASAIDVAEIWISSRHLGQPCTELLLEAAPHSRLRFLHDGERIVVGDTVFTVTIPRLRYKKSPLNNGSVVLRAEIAGTTVLLPGDIEREAERTIVEEARERLSSVILKVPHHGSRTSTTDELLLAVRPRVAVISCEAGNLYGHPAEEVLRRLRAASAQVLRTDRYGSIRIEPSPAGLRIRASVENQPVSLTRSIASL